MGNRSDARRLEIDSRHRLDGAVERLDRLRFPVQLSFERSGAAVVAAVRPASQKPYESLQSRIWRFGFDGSQSQRTFGPNADDLPRCSPVDDRIAFASDRRRKGKMELFLLKGARARPLGEIPGTVEDLRWTADGETLIVLAADRGLDAAATDGAMRLAWDAPEDPAVINQQPRRRLFRVRAGDGATTEIGPVDHSVWEFDLIGNDGAVAVVSADASERGWYHAKLARLDFRKRRARILHSPRWQLQSPTVSPSGRQTAFLEGWSSDRGLVASGIRMIGLETGKLSNLAGSAETSNVTTIQWRDEKSLWFAGWQKLGSIHGIVGTDGKVAWSRYEDAIVGTNSFTASLTPAPDGSGFAAVRETAGKPPEIEFKSNPDGLWKRVTRLNGAVRRGFKDYPEVRPIRWQGSGQLELVGLVLLPRDRRGPLPMVVDIHGGPSWAAKYAFDPGHAVPLAAAGYAIFLPNYRGNAGWGQDFARLNIGDPAGAEFTDILRGIDRCVAEGIADPRRLGVTGASYGGYLTAWAVATTRRFGAAVMVSGIANQWSSHYSCNHDFSELIVGGPLHKDRYRNIAIDRSPVFRLGKPTAATLIIHGSEDRCTPIGQAQEFYSALLEKGGTAELVIYPREGHGLRERGHRRDAWQRTAGWFDRWLRPSE
jgi:dipeptidyl aminopeptidase/acylaminoacyl peptidase